MADKNRKPVIRLTRDNISWAVEFTGRSREELEKALEEAEADDIVCTVEVK